MKYLIASSPAGIATCTFPDRHGNVSRASSHHTENEAVFNVLLAHMPKIIEMTKNATPGQWADDEETGGLTLQLALELTEGEKESVGEWLDVTVVAKSKLSI